ncbi:MAG TPA: hypothetical protein VIM98_18070 [Dyella sp.]|uniref:hypothetical protein n=1 Tax=Dyella sp. TaxID=1869338 RepID=UPI002F9444DD
MTDIHVEPHDVPAELIEHTLRYIKSMLGSEERRGNLQTIGLSKLCVALESRLANAIRLIRHTLLHPSKRKDVLHSIAVLDHLIREALELCWAIRELESENVTAAHPDARR